MSSYGLSGYFAKTYYGIFTDAVGLWKIETKNKKKKKYNNEQTNY